MISLHTPEIQLYVLSSLAYTVILVCFSLAIYFSRISGVLAKLEGYHYFSISIVHAPLLAAIKIDDLSHPIHSTTAVGLFVVSIVIHAWATINLTEKKANLRSSEAEKLEFSKYFVMMLIALVLIGLCT